MSDDVKVIVETFVLDQMIADLPRKAGAIVKKHGERITTRAVTVRPWKRQSGTLIGSTLAESKMVGPLTFYLQDGTRYGLRLELGFVGKDKAGRIYNQPAFPWVVPAVEWGAEAFFDAFRELFK